MKFVQVYIVDVTRDSEQWSVSKRYSEFRDLHEKVRGKTSSFPLFPSLLGSKLFMFAPRFPPDVPPSTFGEKQIEFAAC